MRTKKNQKEENSRDPVFQCAVELLETVPVLMGMFRCDMLRHAGNRVTLVQFRVLAFLNWGGSASLSCLAHFLGIGLPAASKVVDGLVKAGLAKRWTDVADRRRLLLELTDAGRREAESTRRIAQGCMAELLSPLAPGDADRLREALQALRPLFVKKPAELPRPNSPPLDP